MVGCFIAELQRAMSLVAMPIFFVQFVGTSRFRLISTTSPLLLYNHLNFGHSNLMNRAHSMIINPTQPCKME